MWRLPILLSLFPILLISQVSSAASLEGFLTALSQMTISKKQIGCPPPPYTDLTVIPTVQLQALYLQTTSAKKDDACTSYEQAHTISEQLLAAGFRQNFDIAIRWEMTGLNQLMARKDYDSLIARARDAIYNFKFTQDDPNPNYVEIRFLIVRAAGYKVELRNAYYDNSMNDAVLGFSEAGSSEPEPQDFWLLRYDRFIRDYPDGAHTPEVTQMRRRAIDLMIARQLDVAQGYDKHRRWGDSPAGARKRLILAYSIPGALDETTPGNLDSPQILEVMARAIHESEKIIARIKKLQEDTPVDLRAGSPMDVVLSELYPMFKEVPLEQRDPQAAVDFLQTEIQKTRQTLAMLPGGQAWLRSLDQPQNQ